MEPDLNKVFVGGIPWETTEDSLRDYFTAFGEVVDVIIIKDRLTGRARGFGFVEFTEASVAEKVIHEKHTVDGRSVEVKKAVRREEHQNHSRISSIGGSPASANNTRTKKIFVGGLASTVSEEDFKKYFEQFGMITDAVVMYDHTTQRPRGFGFITFDSEDAVDRALQKSLHELHDKTVEVKKAVPKELSSGRQGFGPGRGASFGAGYGYSNSASPSPGYGAPHYVPSPGPRGFFPPYGAPAFGSPGYGPPGVGYGVAMNGGFGGSMYGGAGYPSGPYAVGYGAGPTAGYVGVPAGYGTVGAPPSPAGVRSPWGGSGYAGCVSPAYSGGANAYGKASWRPGSGAPNTVTAYSSVSYNPAMSDNTINSNPARNATGAAGSYGDAYAASIPYGSTESRGSPATPSSLSSGAVIDPAVYGVAGRRLDARFRPYPASVDRVP